MLRLLEILKRYDYVLVMLLLIGVSLFMMSQQTNYQQSKIIQWSNSAAAEFYAATSAVNAYFGLRSENERLVAENAALRHQIEQSYISFDTAVFSHTDTVYHRMYHYITADVIKNSWNMPTNYIMLSKGRRHGVRPDMAVISPQGMVGIVVNVSNNFSTVMTLLHPESNNSVKVKRTGVAGTLIWEGGDFRTATVLDIPTTYRLNTGDTIITSGQDLVFPEGISVGYVDQASTIAGSGFYSIKIRLATEFNHLNHVYIVSNLFAQEQNQLEAQNQ